MQEDVKDPLSKLSLREGTKISKTLSRFLRHGMNVAQYCEIDGSIELEELEMSIGIKAELILISVNPAFHQNKKRKLLVTEKVFPGGQTRISVAALGGLTFKVPTSPGHYQLGKESLVQLSPLLHNTSAIKAITESGFLLQQARRG